ncbi:MAG TPA: hypothetical protein VMF60_03770, partial [Acidimicrobiales bacterium]|nr:hypothetical protein [Acidimicrobiales bacterium]
MSGIIGAFSPHNVPADAWARVQVFVREAVTASKPPAPLIADHAMTVVCQLALWADRIGMALDPQGVFAPETIDRFLLEGVPHLTEGSRLNYRTHLWKVGAAVLGHDLFPPKPLPLQRSAVSPPYDRHEITNLVSWARGLPTTHMRRNARALLAIGLGAGLASNEIQRLVGTDVSWHDGDVVVDVPGTTPRRVPVLP